MSEVKEKPTSILISLKPSNWIPKLDTYENKISSLEVQVKDCESFLRQRAIILESKKECQE